VTEVAPERGTPAFARFTSRELAVAAAASLLAAGLFWSPLLLGGALSGRDWASHHWHYYDWVRTSLLEHGTLPLFMADAWVTKNFLGNAESPSLSPLTPALLVMSTGAYLKLLIWLWSAAGLLGFWLLLRDLGAGAAVAATAAAGFAFGGFTVSHVSVGHPWALGGAVLPWLVLLFRRAALGNAGALLGAAALNAVTIFGGQHQPFVWQNLFLGAFAVLWAVRVRAVFPLLGLAWLWALTFGLGAVKLLPMAAEFVHYNPEARTSGFPVRVLLLSLVGRGQNPDFAAGGLAFTHGAGWWEYAFYTGSVLLLVMLCGALAARRAWPLLAIGVFFLLLTLERPFGLDLWGALDSLPVLRSQRSPSRFLFLALFAFLVAGGLGLERGLCALREWSPQAARVLPLLLAFVVAGDLFLQSLPWQRAAVGPAIQSVDHRPRPFRIEQRGEGARAELRGFSPNRLVYHVTASSPTRLVLPFRYGPWGPEWRVDGATAAEQGGRLALELTPGERDVALRYRPAGLWLGTAITALTLLGVVGLWLRRRVAA
jgi:hypothetical protein